MADSIIISLLIGLLCAVAYVAGWAKGSNVGWLDGYRYFKENVAPPIDPRPRMVFRFEENMQRCKISASREVVEIFNSYVGNTFVLPCDGLAVEITPLRKVEIPES